MKLMLLTTGSRAGIFKQLPAAGLPDFSRSKQIKTGKIYKIDTKYTKRPHIIPHGQK
jgi:hypothetical protein